MLVMRRLEKLSVGKTVLADTTAHGAKATSND
jgi:hypothetical protein